MSPDRVKVVAFDCDGVLFDSRAANEAYYNQILGHLHLPEMRPDQLVYVHMHTVHEALAFLLSEPLRIEAAEDYRRTMDPMRFIRLMTVEPHLHTLLDALKPRFRTAIATNRVDTMNRVLAAHDLQTRFDKVVTAADVAHAKPHPDQLLKLLDYFRIAPAEMIYIGDSQVDSTAARQAGVPFVAYGNPDLAADAHIDGLDQVLTLLAE